MILGRRTYVIMSHTKSDKFHLTAMTRVIKYATQSSLASEQHTHHIIRNANIKTRM